jgi:two-component system, LytTR family, sensor kinase
VLIPRPFLTPLFWRLQLTGWFCYSATIMLATLAFWRNREEFVYHAALVTSAFAASFLLRLICRRLWRARVAWPRAMVLAFVSSYVLGFACGCVTALAMARYGSVHRKPFDWGEAFAGSISACFLLAMWSALYFGVKHYGALEEERRRALAAEASAREAELRALRYQMHPHFLFNTLNAISTLVHDGRTQAATRMIARLGDFLRATLEGDGRHQVPLADELFLTEQYLEIEKIRLGDRIQVSVEVDPTTLDALVPHLLLQPVVENAIRHGISKRLEGGHLGIRIGHYNHVLKVCISDDGVGAQASQRQADEPSLGIGLENIRARLRQLYEDKQQVAVKFPRQGGCEVEISIPLCSQQRLAGVNGLAS